ncbi:hypothetical protein ATE84_4905 [Aquimarina sp. MAR_2010_214]|nr:hypothetical protein ATE84_4905 [Aquimarina sp. MAR_2010_214]
MHNSPYKETLLISIANIIKKRIGIERIFGKID